MKIANIGGARASTLEYREKEHYLLFNGFAMFALMDEYGNEFHVKIMENTEEGFAALVKTACILAEQGELARRDIGLENREILTVDMFARPRGLQPGTITILRNACLDAINLGYEREITDEDEEIDLGLIDIQKKREPQGPSM